MTEELERVPSKGPDMLFGYLIPLVVIGLSIADFIRDGQIDKYLLGSLVVFGLSALGYRVDTAFTQYVNRNKPATAIASDEGP